MNSRLDFDSIELEYGTQKILSSVSMHCNQGEIVGLLGRNGSGKSSLMRIIFGSIQASHSSIRINHKPLINNPKLQRMINYLPQDSLIPSYITIQKALKFFSIDEEELTTVFPIARDWIKLYPRQCSGGAIRLLEALIIIMSKAPFCFLDEPFTGLMPVHIETLKRVMEERKKLKGIIITDHLYHHVLEIADRNYVLANGKTYPISNQDHLIKYGYLHEK